LRRRITTSNNHKRALETHIRKAKAAGITDEEVKHALVLLIPTAGFPTFMKSYAVFKNMG
jgi:alkylhydroperoxidase/carboxymuconolactone decarboxylase family protein YurZ